MTEREGAIPGLASLLAGLLALSACAAPPETRRPGERLEQLIQQYVDLQQDADGRDPIFSDEASEASLAQRAHLLAALRELEDAELSPDQHIDRRFLVGVLETDINTARVQRRWENDPAMYLPSRELGLLLDPAAPESAGERANALGELLARSSMQLGLARQNLGRPPLRYTREAIFQAGNTLESIHEHGGAFDGLPVAAELGSFAQVLQEHLRYLEQELLPRSDGTWAFGKENYDLVLRRRWFLDADADEILARGWAAFEQTEALAQKVAERIEPGRHWTEVYEGLKDQHPPADGIKAAYQAQMDAARRFVLDTNLVTLPEGERVVTIDTPAAMRRSSPFGTFQTVSPHDDGMEGRLILTPIETWMSPEQQAQRLRSHHDAWIPVIAVHEAYPGHHTHALKTRTHPRILRRVSREPIFSEGWGLFTEELMYELGFLQGDDVRLTQLRNRLWRAARVILDASLHTGRLDFDEAVQFLVERVRFEPYAAELEVGMYIRRPTYVLGYLIGMQELMAIRDDWVARHGEPSPPSAFYDRLLQVGSLPPALVREALLGGAQP